MQPSSSARMTQDERAAGRREGKRLAAERDAHAVSAQEVVPAGAEVPSPALSAPHPYVSHRTPLLLGRRPTSLMCS